MCYARRAMRTFALAWIPLAWMLLLLPGCCSSCGCGSAAPRAGGPTPYARCAIAEAPAPRQARVGDLTLRLEGRELAIEGLPETFPVAIARGPAPFRAPIGPALSTLAGSGVRLAIVLGSLGDDEATTIETVAALAELTVPTLILAGGRDDPGHLRAALDALGEGARDRVIDVSALRRVRLGPALVLVPAPGAPEGRYARGDSTCGIGEDDLEQIAGELGEPGDELRILLSWAAPAGSPAALGIEGGDAGSATIAALISAIHPRGALVGWPESHAGRVLGEGADRVAVAPALSGPALVRADGSLAPSTPLVLELGPGGIGTATAPDSP